MNNQSKPFQIIITLIAVFLLTCGMVGIDHFARPEAFFITVLGVIAYVYWLEEKK